MANRPGVGSVIVGATKLHQLEENLRALDFEIPEALTRKLDAASVAAPTFPYTFFTPGMQAMLTGGAVMGDKPGHYAPMWVTDAKPAGVE